MIIKNTKSLSSESETSGEVAAATISTPAPSPAPITLGALGGIQSIGGFDSKIKIKTLPPSVVKDIEQKNIARKLADLSPIVIKIRRCIACGSAFESAGNRTCGCSSRTAGTIAGREII